MVDIKRIAIFISICLCYNCDSVDDHIDMSDLNEKVEIFKQFQIDKNPIFIVEGSSDSCYVVNKSGHLIDYWNFNYKTGNDVQLDNEGNLLGIFKPNETPEINFGGYGGIIQHFDTSSTLIWEYHLNNSEEILHHDVEFLPNGNILALVWERINTNEAVSMGVDTDVDIFTEKIIEINPNNNKIVWEWKSINHIIQNNDITKPNYGNPISDPSRIDINFVDSNTKDGDIMHANGIDYCEERDIIFLSVNFYNEIWVIDHSTSISESHSSFGGDYRNGGDLIYRFGNPSAYGETGRQLFDRVHFPNLIEDNIPGKGNILTYSNGISNKQSSVLEIQLPLKLELRSGRVKEPLVVWEYTNDSIFSKILCGAVRLKNGNTLITEADYGLWEITPNKEVVWKYKAYSVDNILQKKNIWRAYKY